MSEDLPLPLTPLMPTRHPSGMSMSTFLRLLPLAPRMPRDSPLPRRLGYGDAVPAAEVVQGEGVSDDAVPEGVRIGFLSLQHPGCRGAQAYPAALLAGSRPHIDYPVCGVHGLGVVLDHHHGIAFVAEFLE